MNDPKMLKIALAVVIVASAVFVGYSWNSQRNAERKFQEFAIQMSEAQTEQQAAEGVLSYLESNSDSLAPQSANAGLFGWFKKAFGGSSSSHQDRINRIYEQQAEDYQTSHDRTQILQ